MVLRILLGALVIAVCCSCSSVPTFRSSTPVASAASLEEALLLCQEYKISLNDTRANAVWPYRKCLNEASAHFPSVIYREFDGFLNELNFRSDVLRDDEWGDAAAARWTLAVRALLRVMSNGGYGVSLEEKSAIITVFPWTARALDVASWPVASVEVDPGLWKLQAGIAGIFSSSLDSGAATPGAPDSREAFELCIRLKRLKGEVDYLAGLWQDQRNMARIDPDYPGLNGLAKRYDCRLVKAQEELTTLRERIKVASQAGRFRVSGCARGYARID
jgi:hypothetical protein